MAVGPNNHYAGPIPSGTSYYEVEAYLPQLGPTGYVTGNFGLSASVKYTYELDQCDEDPSGFTRVRLMWINDLGGWDSFNFVKANTEQYSKESSSYYDLSQDFSGNWSFDPYQGGELVYSSSINIERTISSDWVTEKESEFLKYLFKSPRVFAYLSTSTSEKARPVTISYLS